MNGLFEPSRTQRVLALLVVDPLKAADEIERIGQETIECAKKIREQVAAGKPPMEPSRGGLSDNVITNVVRPNI